uniref:Uncharacterized protein n=1 Tax=Romanomermis culicivorax TaxID=13658 RepID=A0A915I4V2_ROMCU
MKYNGKHYVTGAGSRRPAVESPGVDLLSIAGASAFYATHPKTPVINARPYFCRNPNFPNPDAEYTAHIHLGSKATSLSGDFLLGLSRYKITELELLFDPTVKSVHSASSFLRENFFSYFRYVKKLKFIGQSPIFNRQNFPDSFSKLKFLQMLTIRNFSNVGFPNSTAFTENLLYMQIYHSSITKIPEFLTESARKLEYLKIQYTNIREVDIVAKLENLKLCFLPRNKIQDLSATIFSNKMLTDLDLSYNQIENLSHETFSGLTSLIFLDLSNNPLSRIPSGMFVTLRKLKWLYLSHEDDKGWNINSADQTENAKILSLRPSLEYLATHHFAGLSSLQYLSLANNPRLKLDYLALKPLGNLEKLDMQNCNLTFLPDSLVDLCKLKFVRFNNNRLKFDSSFPPQIYAYLSQRLDEIDINDNFIITPKHKISLIESIVMALKQQSIWWLDKCCAFYWQLYLMDENQNDTLRDQYNRKFGSSSLLLNQTGTSSLNEADKRLCRQRYSKMTRELAPYTYLGIRDTCQALKREKLINRQLRHELRRASGLEESVVRESMSDEEQEDTPNHRHTQTQNDVDDYFSTEMDDVEYSKKTMDGDGVTKNVTYHYRKNKNDMDPDGLLKLDEKNIDSCRENPLKCHKKRQWAREPQSFKNYSLWDDIELSPEECRRIFDRANLLGYLLTITVYLLKPQYITILFIASFVLQRRDQDLC